MSSVDERVQALFDALHKPAPASFIAKARDMLTEAPQGRRRQAVFNHLVGQAGDGPDLEALPGILHEIAETEAQAEDDAIVAEYAQPTKAERNEAARQAIVDQGGEPVWSVGERRYVAAGEQSED